MNKDETCEILDLLRESLAAKNWALVEEAIMYMKDYCHDYDDDENED